MDDIALTGTAPAPVVTTAAASSPTSTGATLGGTVTNGTAVTEYGVVYSTTNNLPTTADTKVAITSGSAASFSQAVALAVGTYYVRAYAIGSATSYGGAITVVVSPVPLISALSPSSVIAGSSAPTLIITGVRFVQSSTVTYNGAARTSTTNSATQITLPLTAADVATPGSYPVVVTNSAPGGGTSNTFNLTVTPVSPTLSVTPTALNIFGARPGAPSAAQSYALKGINLTADVAVAAPGGYEVSLDNITFAGSITALAANVQTTNGQPIYVRLTGSMAGTYGTSAAPVNVTNTSTSATANEPVYGATVTPTLSAAPTSLSGFTYVEGAGPSGIQNYVLTITDAPGLAGSVVATAPSGYELSSSATFATANAAVTFSYTGTGVSQTATAYVRLKAGLTAAGSPFTGTITNNHSALSLSAPVTVSGTVTPAPVLLVSSTSLNGFSTTQGTASAFQTYTLMGANLTGSVTVTAPSGYEVAQSASSSTTTPGTYAATQTVAQSSGNALATIYVRLTAATANTYSGNVTNAASGATTQNVAVTGTVAPPPAPTISSFAPASGPVGTSVTISGSNFTSGSTVAFNGTAATSVTFNGAGSLTATVPGGATSGPIVVGAAGGTATSATSFTVLVSTITVTPTTLAGLNTTTNTPSAAQTYQVSGSTLDGTTLTVTPSNSFFEVSLNGTTFSSSASINLGGSSTLAATTVYVRLASLSSASTYAGTITNTGSGTSASVAVSGAALAPVVAKRWTGGANTPYWFDAANWDGGTLPGTGDDVILDHRTVTGKYIVSLLNAAGVAPAAVTVASLRLRPGAAGDSIVFNIPNSNTISSSSNATNPGAALYLSRAVAGDTALSVGNKAAVYNRSGATSAGVTLGASTNGATTPTVFLLNGGSFYQRTARSATPIIEHLSGAAGTETGSYFFRIPGSGSSTLSLSGRTFGNLVLQQNGATSYTGSGASDLTINGSLTIETGVTFSPTLTANIVLKGNLVNTGNFRYQPSSAGTTGRRLLLQGTAPQTLAGTALGDPATATSYLGTFAQLEISNPAGVTLQTPVLLSNNLYLTSGLLTTTGGLLTIGSATAAISGYSATSFVNGPLARATAAGAAATLFPIGKGAAYRPLTLSTTTQTNATTYQAEQFEGDPGQAGTNPAATNGTDLTRVSKVRSFTVTPATSPGTYQGTITLSYGADDQVTDPTTLVIAKRATSAASWANFGYGGSSASTVTSGSFTSFSDFALASTNPSLAVNPLPVSLTRFTAARRDGSVALAWATASEQNSARFEVERSLDGVKFSTVATVAAHGTSLAPLSYAALDRDAPSAALYYRLRLVDANGSSAYSATVAVAGTTAELLLSPNPARDQVRLTTATATPYVVRSALGQVVLSGTTEAGTSTVALQSLVAGVYFFELQAPAGRLVQKLVKE